MRSQNDSRININVQAHATQDQRTFHPGVSFLQASDPSSHQCSNIQGALSLPEADTASLSTLPSPLPPPFLPWVSRCQHPYKGEVQEICKTLPGDLKVL